ncbi:MAG: hypothetical protein JRI23_16715, partial [Deltaproteobacteria bacterium]|jgi:hypothetical protein|nr:hypothetical protein [Deltaproteobacteria bacterium]MBW2533430.1 hypothetical protein [Deltaproteobacteria bacterium]
VLALWLGLDTLAAAELGDKSVLRHLGVPLLAKPPSETTFELVVRDLGHALFPWSAFLPFAIGRLLLHRRRPDADAAVRDLALRLGLLLGTATAYGALTLLAPYAGAIAFAAPALLAAVAAMALLDLEQGARPSPTVAGGTLLLAIVLWRDMVKIPVKALSAYGVSERTLPKGVEGVGAELVLAAAAVFATVAFLSWLEHSGTPTVGSGPWIRARLAAYRSGAQALARLWKGNLLFGLLVAEAALVGLGAMLYVGRRLGWSAVERFPHNVSLIGVNAWWVLPLAPVAAVLSFELVRAVFAQLLSITRLPRASAMALGALVAGGILCFGYYPALAAQLSPKAVFERYAEVHGAGQPLGVLGLRVRAAEFYAQGEHVEALSSARAAHRWLTATAGEGEEARRFLVFRSKDLPELNSLFREHAGENLPVLDARSGTILLASNELGGLPNVSWLEPYVRSEVGAVQHPVSAVFEDKLEALGWDVIDDRGRAVAHVVPQRAYRMRFYYRVLGPITRSYKAFLHIDGHRRRHNGDHEPLRGEYPLTRWRPGDVIVDEYPLTLEPNFTPGRYSVYYGFFQGKNRFAVRKGPHHDNRIDGGTLVVR